MPNIDVRSVKESNTPRGPEVEVLMKVDDTYVTYVAHGSNLQRDYTKTGNPSVKPTQAQLDAATRKGRQVIQERGQSTGFGVGGGHRPLEDDL